MNTKFLSTALVLTLLFALGPKFSLEARHPHSNYHSHSHRHHRSHVSVNAGVALPVYSNSYVTQTYRPAYVQPSYYYPETYYYPNESVTVYHNPQPVVREVHTVQRTSPSPLWFLSGLTLGFLLR